jgi:hypothetical protein
VTTEEALAALAFDADDTVEVRGTIRNPRAAGRQTINRWSRNEAESTLGISTLSRVEDDEDGCRIHAVTPGGRTYRFAAN